MHCWFYCKTISSTAVVVFCNTFLPFLVSLKGVKHFVSLLSHLSNFDYSHDGHLLQIAIYYKLTYKKRKNPRALWCTSLLLSFIHLLVSVFTYSVPWLSDLQSSVSGKFSSYLFCFPPDSFYIRYSSVYTSGFSTPKSQFFRQNCFGSFSIFSSVLFYKATVRYLYTFTSTAIVLIHVTWITAMDPNALPTLSL